MSVASSSRKTAVAPAADYGFFGPDSVTWKVWRYPTSLTIGFQRAVTVEELDPALVAAVDATQAIRYRPRARYDRTLTYFGTVAFGDSARAMKLSDILVKVHSKAVGIDPLTGNVYDANDPHSQLWIHMTAWHSILYSYERFGPGRLSEAEENQYWEECAIAAELQTCDPADVPRTREGVRQYFESMRPKLAGSIAAQSTMDHLLDAEVMFPPMPAVATPAVWVVNMVMRWATIATMPQWMRKMAGLRQGKLVDLAVTPVMKISMKVLSHPRLSLLVLSVLSPGTEAVFAPVLRNVEPVDPVVITPAEARERYGYVKPSEAHHELRAKQRNRVLLEGVAPSDSVITESEAYLGKVG
ncbi:oxygenase MpaB family protein [Smaragdicoccus niigatensis]|uniref:oxygenase MpaB family protein n=1 Tax=Smaragdicoccus niigatensis TaxID=359359 RepID=UPI0004760F9C|nr:oxygenase MpaB family protein [Smaragdicoccus niigatensis]